MLKPGSKHVLHGEGMPKAGSWRRGDLYLHIEVAFPDVLDQEATRELSRVVQQRLASLTEARCGTLGS